MAATDTLNNLDSTLKQIRDEYEAEIKTMKDALLAAQIEASMATARMKEALFDRDAHMRVSTKLITQFGVVEAVFADAKALALSHFGEVEKKVEGFVTEGKEVLTNLEHKL